MCPGESELRKMVADSLHVPKTAVDPGKVGQPAGPYCHERAFGFLPRTPAQSHFVPESIRLPGVAVLHYFYFAMLIFLQCALKRVYSRRCFCKPSLWTGKKRKRQARSLMETRDQVRSSILWPYTHLHFTLIKQLLQGNGSAGAQSVPPMGTAWQWHTPEWQPDTQNCTSCKQPRWETVGCPQRSFWHHCL